MTRSRIALALFVMAAVVVAIIAVTARRGAPQEKPQAQATKATAVAAAADALYALSVPAITSPSRFDQEVIRRAAPGAENRVQKTFGATEPAVLAAFKRQPRVLRGAPLGYRIDSFDGETASVAIWSVVIAASDGFGSESQWRTLTVDLRWTATGWKVTGGHGVAGPEPSTPLRKLAREASTFRSFAHVP